jgi:molybdopterin biosynthesis enzyme
VKFFMVRIVNGGAEHAFKASGDITSMAGAAGYLTVPAATEAVSAGASVTVTLY